MTEPEPRLPPTTAAASELYGGTRNDDKLPKAAFPVLVQRVARLCCANRCGNCYLVETFGAQRVVVTTARRVLHSGANGQHPLHG